MVKKLLSCILVLTMLTGFLLMPSYAEFSETVFDMTQGRKGNFWMPNPSRGSGVTTAEYSTPNALFLKKGNLLGDGPGGNTTASSTALAGPSGEDNDIYYGYCLPGSTNGPTNGYQRGVVYNLSEGVNDTVFCVQGDFLSGDSANWASLISPNAGTEAYLKDGNIYWGDTKIGEAEVNRWFNVGVVFYLSSTSGSKADVYLNGRLVVSDYSQPNMTGGINSFRTLLGCTASGKVGGKFMYYDNMKFGINVSEMVGDFNALTVYPANGATDVSRSTPIVINLNRPADETTIAAELVNITPSVDKTVTLSEDKKTLTIIPSENYAANTAYSVSLSSNIKDKYGISYSGADISFTTSETEGSFGVVSSIPANGTELVDVKTFEKVSILFNMPVNIGTVSDAVSVSPAIEYSLSMNETNTELYITPSCRLEGYEEYTVTIDSSVLRSVSNSSMSESYITKFKMGGYLNWSEDFNSDELLNTTPTGFSAGVVVSGDDGNMVRITGTGKKFFSVLEKDENGVFVQSAQKNKTVYAKYRIKFENAGTGTCMSGIRGLEGQGNWWNSHLLATVSNGSVVLQQKRSGNRTYESSILFENGKWYEVGYKVVMDGANPYSGSFYLNGEEFGIGLGTDKGNKSFDIFYADPVASDTSKEVVLYIDDIEVSEDENILKPNIMIASSNPENNDTEVSSTGGIVLEFTTPVDPSTVSDAIVLLDVTGGNAAVEIADMTLSEGNTVLTVMPKDNLKYSNDYKLKINTQVLKSEFNRGFKGNGEIVFTTKAVPKFKLSTKFYSGSGADKTLIENMTNGAVTAEATVVGAVGISGIVMFAHYSGGKLVDAVIPTPFSITNDVEGDSKSAVFENCLESDEIKILVWNSLDKIKPLAEKVTFPQQ